MEKGKQERQQFKIGFIAGLVAGMVASGGVMPGIFNPGRRGHLAAGVFFGSTLTALMPASMFDFLHQLIGGMPNITFSMVFWSANAWVPFALERCPPTTCIYGVKEASFLLASNHPPTWITPAGKRRCNRPRARLNCTRGWCLPLCSGCWLALCFCHLQALGHLWFAAYDWF